MDERRDDWRSGVDRSLVSLNAAQRVTDQQLDDLDIKYDSIDRALRGDPQEDTDGFLARLHHVENGIQEIRAELIKLRISDVEVKGFRWEFLTKVTVQILILLGLLLMGWEKVEDLVKRVLNQKESPLEEKIDQAKHPKSQKKIYRIRHVQAETPSESTKELPPNP